jgi:hypothetical protein
MKGIIKEEFNRAFRNPRFLIVIVLALAVFGIGAYRSPFPFAGQAMHPVNRLLLNLHYGEFGFLAPLLATLLFADSFLDDLNQGFLRQIIQRVPFRKYRNAKIMTVAVTGGLSLVLSVLLVFTAGLAGATDWESTAYFSGYINPLTEPWGPLGGLYPANPIFYLLYLLASVFCFGAVYAVLGLAISSFIHNRYVALAGPLVLVQVLDFLEGRALHVTMALNPLNGLLPFTALTHLSSGYTLVTQLAQFGTVFIISVIGFLILAHKQRLTI